MADCRKYVVGGELTHNVACLTSLPRQESPGLSRGYYSTYAGAADRLPQGRVSTLFFSITPTSTGNPRFRRVYVTRKKLRRACTSMVSEFAFRLGFACSTAMFVSYALGLQSSTSYYHRGIYFTPPNRGWAISPSNAAVTPLPLDRLLAIERREP